MGEREEKSDEVKINVAQEAFIKNLIMMKCKTESENEEVWQVPEMVGYYSETSLPITPIPAVVAEESPVKKVVCSPDLPIPEYKTTVNSNTINNNNSNVKPMLINNSIGQGTDSVQCPICNKMYTSKAAFQAHQRTHAKETEDPYRCNICSKTFAVPARLTRHYRTHTGEKPFRCEFCNKSFSVKENLSVHRRIHTKERPYKCDVCSRAFEHSGKLHRHMRIHTGERPHKCTVCAKTFIQSGQLVIHMRTHTGEKPYVCLVCQKGFTCSKQLKVHSRTHTGEKPYSCDICGKSFGYNHVLKLHQVAHYGEKVYKCTICNDTFNSKKSMEAHIKSHSDNAPPQPPITPPASATSESSCSSSSDKENSLKDSPIPQSYDSDINYYLYSRDRLSPASTASSSSSSSTYAGIPTSAGVELLATAAAAAAQDEKLRNSQDVVFNFITKSSVNGSDVVAAALRSPYFPAPPPTIHYASLTAADGIRKCVEAALAVENVHVPMPLKRETVESDPLKLHYEEDLITPPSSNPVSPAPSVSPDPELSLPPRKRSKMILKSMEATSAAITNPVRYNSVIQFARAS